MDDILLSHSFDDGRIVQLTLNRPEVMNAFNTELAQRLGDSFDRINGEPITRVVIITGSGTRSFCTGGDFKEREGMTDDMWAKQHRLFEQVHWKIRHCPRPVICAVNGYALGGGCELAMSGDIIYSSENARFGLPEVTRGIIPGVGGTQLLGRLIPRAIAIELLLTGKHVTAQEAFEYGLVNKICSQANLLSDVLQAARMISKNSPFAVRMAKRSFYLGMDLPREQAIEGALDSYYRTANHPDRIEGVRAFNEKRPPSFDDDAY
ncbi:MAG: enoyl-CoA hydratase/isomerase family protein [archaeon]|nr:enoyl-CoA hydratase/isomerase family protein [archaeon]